MLLETIEAVNFRNLSGRIHWDSGLNILFGDNGQGKTNWLEALNLLATTKSFRTQRLQEATRFGENLAIVRGTVAHSSSGIKRDLQVNVQASTKSILVNGKREPLSRYLSQLHVVTFTSPDLEIVRGGPESRREFVDKGVVSLHASYAKTLADFQRVIKQKNRLLRHASDTGVMLDRANELIAPWNDQLVEISAQIHTLRTDYIARLDGVLDRSFFGPETISIRYVSSLEGKGDLNDYRSLIAERLKIRLQAELASGHSLIGPQRDDLEILFDGRDIRAFGSAGQQRSALITLDLAAISLYHSYHNEYPLFLIDDVDAELDRKRISALLDHLAGRTQTFITTSKESLAEQFVNRAMVCEISAGSVVGGTCQKGPETGGHEFA
jgi:DNA replication and repair protein RecF